MIECFCKGLLPSTIVKIFNLFMDLSIHNEISSHQINDSHRWLYDSLVLVTFFYKLVLYNLWVNCSLINFQLKYKSGYTYILT